jgi:hypothetical protein
MHLAMSWEALRTGKRFPPVTGFQKRRSLCVWSGFLFCFLQAQPVRQGTRSNVMPGCVGVALSAGFDCFRCCVSSATGHAMMCCTVTMRHCRYGPALCVAIYALPCCCCQYSMPACTSWRCWMPLAGFVAECISAAAGGLSCCCLALWGILQCRADGVCVAAATNQATWLVDGHQGTRADPQTRQHLPVTCCKDRSR